MRNCLIRLYVGMLASCLMIGLSVKGQNNCGFPAPLKHQKVTFEDAIGTYFKGLLAYLPEGYNPAASTTYPVIIYFHGNLAAGEGTDDDLCKIFSDQPQSLPSKLERGEWPTTISPGGTGNGVPYIVISPQYNSYWFEGGQYPSGDHVSAIIDYIVAVYKVDLNRIYLTGMSSGANMVMEYAGSSLERAQRPAAINVASLCAPLSGTPNGGVNIGQGLLPVWMVHCEGDDPCKMERPAAWDSAINANEPIPNSATPILTRLDNTNPDPSFQCNPYPHDTWSKLYNPAFEVNGMNLFEWFLSNSRSTLPVTFKSFEATIKSGKSFLKWVTVDEVNNTSFTVQRSGDGRQFTSIGTLKGAGNSSAERVYTFEDAHPFTNLTYYRIVQNDVDGKTSNSVIRKVMNKPAGSKPLIVSPNPFSSELSAFVQLNKKQKLVITLTDMNGRRITQLVRVLDEGNSEIALPVTVLKKGIYLLRIEGESISEVQKVIRQ